MRVLWLNEQSDMSHRLVSKTSQDNGGEIEAFVLKPVITYPRKDAFSSLSSRTDIHGEPVALEQIPVQMKGNSKITGFLVKQGP